MSEILKYQNRMDDNAREVVDLRLRLADLRRSMWSALDLLTQVDDLDAKQLMSLAADFGMLQAELKSLLQEQAAIKKVLGR